MSRNGNGNGRTGRVSEAEGVRRVELVAMLIARRRSRGQIRSDLEKIGVHVSPRTVASYIKRAGSLLKSRLCTSVADARAMSLAVYESVIQSPTSSHNERITAQRAIDKLLGLAAKESLQVDVTVEAKEAADLRRLALSELREILAKRADN